MSVSIPSESLMRGVDAAVPTDFVCRLSVEQYHQMFRAGILNEEVPVELLDGWLVPKMIKNPIHSATTAILRDALQQATPRGWHVRVQDPITLAASEPEPDLVVVRGDTRDYLARHPGPADVALVAEVADATLARDQTMKKRLYAQARLPIYWIVNLPDGRLEVYGQPSGDSEPPDYRDRRDYGPAEEVPLVVEGRQVAMLPVRSLLP